MGQPASGSWASKPVRMIGTRSADYIRASGHGAAQTGRTHDLHPTASRTSEFSLQRGRRPHMTRSATSPLWHPGHAHALIDALASSEVSRIVARHVGAEAADGESRVERKSRLRGGPRLIKPTEKRQRGGKIEMRAVDDFGWPRCFDATTRPLPRRHRAATWRSPTNIIHTKASVSRGERRSASWTWASVSSPRPRRYLARPMQACASAKFRSSANACSHSAMPWAARLVKIWTFPRSQVGHGVLRGQGQSLDQGRLGRRETRGPVIGHKPCQQLPHQQLPIRPALRHFRDRAPRRVQKSCALAQDARGSSPCLSKPCPGKYKSIESGCSERSARRASAAMSWAFSVLASLDTISSCMSNRSATGLSKRSAQR